MNKRKFLKTAGLLGVTATLPTRTLLSGGLPDVPTATCTLIPSETAGPFPLDLTTNAFYFRQDVREDRLGVPLRLKMRIIGDGNCEPMQNVRVNIWHCDKDGQYSGYSNSMNPGQAGLTYLRGYQLTDANGEVEFVTIFPGWYPGRVCHIHFQVYVSSSYAAISQLAFDTVAKQQLYADNGSIYTKGTDPLAPSLDNVFSDGYQYQLATLVKDAQTGEYSSFLEVTVKGSGTTGVGHTEKENARQFTLGQNYPNPAVESTTIPITLMEPADVTLDLFDIQGRRVYRTVSVGLQPGDHTFPIDMAASGLNAQSYAYQVQIRNDHGTFTDVKLLTLR